jgi:formate--tetrahydrofolate ligase
MTPTPAGEGKTLTTIGLGQGLARIGRRAIITLRQPSMGPIFGVKGSAVGAGRAEVLPQDDISLHFTGDFHAVASAHNLLAAMMDNHLTKGNTLGLDPTRILFPRTVDMNDRALRSVLLGYGGGSSGVERAGGFVIAAASEVMAILCLASSREDLKRRLGEIVFAFREDGSAVRARDLRAAGAMAALLRDAIRPNLVQTTEGVPALIHGGPFANIAHGTNSVLAMRLARKLAEFTVVETGFAADLGAEKFLNIVARGRGLVPSAFVLVASVRALKRHGGAPPSKLSVESVRRVERGLPNVRKHLDILAGFGIPAVVAVNRFPTDTPAELAAVADACRAWDVPAAVSEAYMRGGEGTRELAERAAAAAESGQSDYRPLYDDALPAAQKLDRLARDVYGADGVVLSEQAATQLRAFERLGYGALPICVAKTQESISDNPKVLGAPTGWELRVREIRLSAGAGFLVAVCGNMLLMPGLPEEPLACKMDVDGAGNVLGLR